MRLVLPLFVVLKNGSCTSMISYSRFILSFAKKSDKSAELAIEAIIDKNLIIGNKVCWINRNIGLVLDTKALKNLLIDNYGGTTNRDEINNGDNSVLSYGFLLFRMPTSADRRQSLIYRQGIIIPLILLSENMLKAGNIANDNYFLLSTIARNKEKRNKRAAYVYLFAYLSFLVLRELFEKHYSISDESSYRQYMRYITSVTFKLKSKSYRKSR